MSTTSLEWEDQIGIVRREDLAEICCKAHGVLLRENRPCFLLHNVLSRYECESIIDAVEDTHNKKPVSLEPGTRSQFVCEDKVLRDLVWNRISHFFPEELDGGRVVGMQTGWRHAKYFPGQSVFGHMDFRHCDNQNIKIVSRISVTIYLNDEGFTGGETSFIKGLQLDGTYSEVVYESVPKAGSAIVFYQCVPEFAHCANIVRDGCKSIMRSDVMYAFETEAQSDPGGVNIS